MENSPHLHNEEHGHNAQITPVEAIQIITDQMAGLDKEGQEYKGLDNLRGSIEMALKNIDHFEQKKEEDGFIGWAETQFDNEVDAQQPTGDYDRKIAHQQLTLRTHIENVEVPYEEASQVGP